MREPAWRESRREPTFLAVLLNVVGNEVRLDLLLLTVRGRFARSIAQAINYTHLLVLSAAWRRSHRQAAPKAPWAAAGLGVMLRHSSGDGSPSLGCCIGGTPLFLPREGVLRPVQPLPSLPSEFCGTQVQTLACTRANGSRMQEVLQRSSGRSSHTGERSSHRRTQRRVWLSTFGI